MLTVVIPLHNEAGVVEVLVPRVIESLETIEDEWRVVLVDDGSTDETWDRVATAAATDARLRGLRLSRNFGHQIALSAGLSIVGDGATVTMDGDLQHPPEMIPALVDKAAEGFDVVYAVPSETDAEGVFKVRSARLFYWVLNRLTSLDLPHGGADFRYMSSRVTAVLRNMPERHRFLRGMSRWIGFPQAVIEYDRAPRIGGATKYTFRRMTQLAFDAIVSFSSLPLRLASVVGFFVAFLGGIYFFYVLGIAVFTDDAVSGWSSVMVVALLLGGVQLAFLGVIGQYLGRVYEESKGRPLFVVRDDTTQTPR